jgi:hypothetical protein
MRDPYWGKSRRGASALSAGLDYCSVLTDHVVMSICRTSYGTCHNTRRLTNDRGIREKCHLAIHVVRNGSSDSAVVHPLVLAIFGGGKWFSGSAATRSDVVCIVADAGDGGAVQTGVQSNNPDLPA